MSDKPKINLSEQNSTILRDICFARMKVLKAGGICSADDLPRKKELMEFTARQSLPVFDFFRSAMAGNVEAAKRQSAVQQTMHPYACGGYYDGIIADYQSIMAALMLRGGYTEEDVQRLHSRVQGFIKSLKTDPARTLYSIPPKIKDQIPDYFYIAFAGELFSVYGWERSRLIFYPENNHAHADLESGTEGWAQAFRATCRKLETGWLLDYYNSLPWYERDVFDGIIEQEIRKHFMNGKDDNVNDYYQYLIEKMHRSER